MFTLICAEDIFRWLKGWLAMAKFCHDKTLPRSWVLVMDLAGNTSYPTEERFKCIESMKIIRKSRSFESIRSQSVELESLACHLTYDHGAFHLWFSVIISERISHKLWGNQEAFMKTGLSQRSRVSYSPVLPLSCFLKEFQFHPVNILGSIEYE